MDACHFHSPSPPMSGDKKGRRRVKQEKYKHSSKLKDTAEKY